MSTETAVSGSINRHSPIPIDYRATMLVSLLLLALLALGLGMRLYMPGLPFDRDSYDEGVYWQSLRAMASGKILYQQVFYSQPPFFLLSIYPLYHLFGDSLWSARLGIALLSLIGLTAAFLLGRVLRGQVGAILALLLLMTAPLYLAESQILQAEAPSVALSLLAVALAYLWWERPAGLAGLWLASMTTLTLALAILCKLLAVSALVPIALLALARLSSIFKQPTASRLTLSRSLSSLIVGLGVFALTMLVILLPFVGAFPQLWSSVVTFHTAANLRLHATKVGNLITLRQFLFTPLTVVAGYASLVALLRRDWRVLPLLAWFLVTAALLWQQVPLFPHHLIALIPPMIALAIMGIDSQLPVPIGSLRRKRMLDALTLLLLLFLIVTNLLAIRTYYQAMSRQGNDSSPHENLQVAQDLRLTTPADKLVITDAQFIAGLADRDTPASLVDTSNVRLQTGYITSEQLIQEASQTRVQTILFYTGRLATEKDFHNWVSQHFQLVHNYGNDRELWAKIQ